MGEVERVDTLAARINAEHRACAKATLTALDHAIRAGEQLTEAKAGVRHGEWGAWLAENFEGSARIARAYRRVAAHRGEIESKRQSSATLSIDAALRFTSPERGPISPEARQRAVARAEHKLYERAELALRTGNPELPADLDVSHAKWEWVLYRVASERERNIPNVLDALAHNLHVLVGHAPAQDVREYLAEPVSDQEEAERRKLLAEELRAGAAWLARVAEER